MSAKIETQTACYAHVGQHQLWRVLIAGNRVSRPALFISWLVLLP